MSYIPDVSVATKSPPKDPYRGIEPFRYGDQPIFFAREIEAQRLLRQVATYRAVLLFGDSGAGKSSLINAGLLPPAAAEGFRPERIRLQPRGEEEIVVERISVVTDGKPPYLPSNLVPETGGPSRVVLSLVQFRERLGKADPTVTPLLIFDQFEELITLFEEAQGTKTLRQTQELKSAITRVLVELIQDRHIRAKLLFSFREDYLAKVLDLFQDHPDLIDHYIRLTPPPIAAIKEIVQGPFKRFPGRFQSEFSENLTNELCESLASRSESGLVNLSEVQIICLRLWRSGNPEELLNASGAQGILEGALSDALEGFGQRKRYAAVALLGQMVTSSGARNVVSAEDLVSRTKSEEGIAEKQSRQALRSLETQTRLIRSEQRHNVVVYEITSEFLIPWIVRQREERLTHSEVEQWLKDAANKVSVEHLSASQARRRASWGMFVVAVIWLGSTIALFFKNGWLATGERREVAAVIVSILYLAATIWWFTLRKRSRQHQRVAAQYSARADSLAERLKIPGGFTREEWQNFKKELDNTIDNGL